MPPAKPIHPSTVHFPIAFLALSFGFDVVYGLTDRLPFSVTSKFPPTTDITRFSYYLLSIGIITSIFAAITGVQQAVVNVQKQGLYENGAIKDKFKAMIAHVVIQDALLLGSALIWYQKRSAARDSVAGKIGVGSMATGAAAYAPTTGQIVAEAVLGLMIGMGANIGHVLALNFGMGLAVGGGKSKSK